MLKSRRGSNIWVTFVVCSLLYCERFFSGYSAPGTPVLASPQKPPFRNSNSSRNHQVEEEPLSGCATSKSLFRILTFNHLFTFFIYIPYAAPLHFWCRTLLYEHLEKGQSYHGPRWFKPLQGRHGSLRMEKRVTNLCVFTIPYPTSYKANLASKTVEQKWHITSVNIFWIVYPNNVICCFINLTVHQ